jgi:hypothetical protein
VIPGIADACFDRNSALRKVRVPFRDPVPDTFMTEFGKYWLCGRAASVAASLALGLSLCCSATGCLSVFGQSSDSAVETDTAKPDQDAPTEEDLSANSETDDDDVAPVVGIDEETSTPAELLETIRESLTETRGQKRPKGSMLRKAWQEAQEHHIAVGVLACRELTEHADSTDEQLREGWKSKAVLLYRATEYGWPKFAERLSRTVEQLKQSSFTEEAEYADGLLLVHRCFE